jgi:hypothetical protein
MTLVAAHVYVDISSSGASGANAGSTLRASTDTHLSLGHFPSM